LCSPFNSCNITPVQTICAQQILPKKSRDIEPEGHAVSIGSSSLCLSKVPENWTYGHSRIPSHTTQIFKLRSSLINTWGFFEHILKSPNPNSNTVSIHIKTMKFPDFFWVPKPFLDDMRKGMTTRHLCCNVIHPAVRPTCCKSCSACWGDPAGFLGQQPAETMLVTQ